jgi:DNA-binding NtrC family response regulator
MEALHIVVPPLRTRSKDIPALVLCFLRQFNERFRREVKGLTPEALAALMAYDSPGNVRELENLLERAYAVGAYGEITRANLPALGTSLPPSMVASAEGLPTIDEAERRLIATALERCGGHKDEAARVLGLSVRTLYRRLAKFRSPVNC